MNTVRMILCGNVEDSRMNPSEKVGVVSVVFVSTEEEKIKNKLKKLQDKNPEKFYMEYVTPLDVDLTSLEHYPSIEISKMIYNNNFQFIIKNPDIKRAEPLPFGGGSAHFISAVLLRKSRPRPTSSGRRRRLPVRCGAHQRCRWPAPASVRRTTRAGRGSSGPSGR